MLIKTIWIITNIQGFGPDMEHGEELEHHLTIFHTGHVWLSNYGYNFEGII